MATINVSTQAARDELEDRLEVIQELAQEESQRVFCQGRSDMFQGQANDHETTRDTIGTRLRRGAVRERPSLDGTFEATLTNAAVERDEGGDIIKLHTNTDADTFLAG